jgi:uncharacterized membrane protein YhdT
MLARCSSFHYQQQLHSPATRPGSGPSSCSSPLPHTLFGYLGLGANMFGQYESRQLGWSIWPILGVATVLGMRFIVDGQSGDEEDDSTAEKLTAGLFSLVALTLYYNVSVDEFFAVLQRYQWMKAQGWDHATMALNIGLSMVILWCILALVQHFAGSSQWLHDWCEVHGDRAMFVVFSLIMYYMVRGILQNGLGYEPWAGQIHRLGAEHAGGRIHFDLAAQAGTED